MYILIIYKANKKKIANKTGIITKIIGSITFSEESEALEAYAKLNLVGEVGKCILYEYKGRSKKIIDSSGCFDDFIPAMASYPNMEKR